MKILISVLIAVFCAGAIDIGLFLAGFVSTNPYFLLATFGALVLLLGALIEWTYDCIGVYSHENLAIMLLWLVFVVAGQIRLSACEMLNTVPQYVVGISCLAIVTLGLFVIGFAVSIIARRVVLAVY
ncbi:MAG TPA: hypothetical protein VEA59_03850 [Patescibacteria group bacterium]|nr:hypothetical protein [Patescibacteria group bacterium]